LLEMLLSSASGAMIRIRDSRPTRTSRSTPNNQPPRVFHLLITKIMTQHDECGRSPANSRSKQNCTRRHALSLRTPTAAHRSFEQHQITAMSAAGASFRSIASIDRSTTERHFHRDRAPQSPACGVTSASALAATTIPTATPRLRRAMQPLQAA